MLAFIHLVAIGEALMLAKRGGVPLETAYEVIRASSGNSFVHETESQVILNGSYDIGFSMDLALKDLGFALQMGREFGVPLELAAIVEGTFARAREQYGGSAQSTQVVKLLEDALGVDLRAAGLSGSARRLARGRHLEHLQRDLPQAPGGVGIERVGAHARAHLGVVRNVCLVAVLEVAPADAVQQRRGREQHRGGGALLGGLPAHRRARPVRIARVISSSDVALQVGPDAARHQRVGGDAVVGPARASASTANSTLAVFDCP